MSLFVRCLFQVAIIFATLTSVPESLAQSAGAGCTLEHVAGTSMHILRCQQGLTITVEPSARYALEDRDKDGEADSVRLRRRALLLEGPAETAGAGFQVTTPQAIAAVRGTKWIVDVQRNRTSVFVVSGQVDVKRPTANGGVSLGPGEGVDVQRGSGPLTVKRWPAARVSALLSRFGL